MKRETSYISLRIKTIHCFWNAIRWYRLPAGEWSAIKAACCLTLCYFDLEQGYNIWTGRKGTWIMQNKADRENRRRVKIISTDNVIHNRLTCLLFCITSQMHPDGLHVASCDTHAQIAWHEPCIQAQSIFYMTTALDLALLLTIVISWLGRYKWLLKSSL